MTANHLCAAAAAVLASGLAAAGQAAAHPRRGYVRAQTWLACGKCHTPRPKPKHTLTKTRPGQHTTPPRPTPKPTAAPKPKPAPPYTPPGLHYRVGDDQTVCNQGGDPGPYLRAHGSNVMRYIVNDGGPSQGDQSGGPACVRAAEREGYRVYLSVSYDSAWSTGQIVARFRSVIAEYGQVWAMSVGNEQDFTQTVAQYVQTWDAVEPVISRLELHAIRVLSDAPPDPVGGRPEQTIAARPVGAQAYAYHCYKAQGGGLLAGGLDGVPKLAKFAEAYRLPIWCSEMAPATAPGQHTWLIRQSSPVWAADVARVEHQSPNLEMAGDYYWPGVGAYARRAVVRS